MVSRKRTLVLVVALAAALVMLFGLASVAFAGGTTTSSSTDKVVTVCVDGYVINHREQPVDGTKTEPQLIVAAVGTSAAYSVTVGSDGYFKFDDPKLAVGDWNFKMQLPEGWQGIAPATEQTGVVAETGATTLKELKEQSSCYHILFKIRRVFGVKVIKWEELVGRVENGSTTVQAGTLQPGKDWKIAAIPLDDPFVKPQTDTTAADGSVWFTLTAGKWIIQETLKSGWTPVTPWQVPLTLDQYAKAGALDPVVFKNLEPPCHSEIDVQKYGWGVDAKTGAVFQIGPLAGWLVAVSRADGMMTPIAKNTDGFGKATFDDLPPGVYVVTEQVQPGWELFEDIAKVITTTNNLNNVNPQTVIHQDCETTSVRFDNKELKGELKISGRKVLQAWVPPYAGTAVGLPGWVMTATLVGSDPEVAITTTTDALGNYTFTEENLGKAGMAFPGASIKVCEESRDNWIHVTPECVMVTFPYPVPATYTGAVAEFANRQDPPSGAARVSVSNVPSVSRGCRATVVVPRGETLARIGAQFGVSVGALVRANGVRNADVIYAGQKLCIP